MSGSVNKLIVIGHLGRDPEIRKTRDGASIATFSIATSERWTDKATGELKDVTNWHRVVVLNDKLVPIVEKYLKKGSLVYIEGQSLTRKYQTRDGQDRYTTELVVKPFSGQLTLLDRAEKAPAPDEHAYGGGSAPPLDDEVPF